MIKKVHSVCMFVICLFVLLLGACHSSINVQQPSDTKEEVTEGEPAEEKGKSPDNEPTHLSEEENTEDFAPNEEDTTDEIETAYAVDPNWYMTPYEDAESKVILLTIDDAPDKYAVEMAETLYHLGVPAIFFVNGHFLQDETGKEMLQKIDALGFPIGNHTMTHADLTTLTEKEQKKEIVGVNQLVKEIIGKDPLFFRAPYGQNTEYVLNLAEKEEMIVMNWSYGYDWEAEYQDADQLADIMVHTPLLGDGAILLMHDRPWTNAALADIVNGLQTEGYGFVHPLQIKHK